MDDENATLMTSQRPYLLRALWEWIGDNGMTTHLLVDADFGGVVVPPHTVKDGKVVLNIADRAVAHLQMGNEEIAFSARFGGVTHAVIVPVGAVLAIYARETGQGMALPPDPADEQDGQRSEAAADTGSVAHLRPVLTDGGDGDDGDGDDGAPPPRKPGGRPSLRVVK